MPLQAWINPTIPFAPINSSALFHLSQSEINQFVHTHTHVLLSEASVVKRQGWSREYSLTSEDLCGGERERGNENKGEGEGR